MVPSLVTACFALGSLLVAMPLPAVGSPRPLGIVGLVLALAGIALVHANGYWKLRSEVRRRRSLQRRIDEISDNLPVVVFQARHGRDGRIHIDLLAGDTPQLFSVSPGELQSTPSRILAAMPPADRSRVLSALVRAMHRTSPVSLRFNTQGVRGPRCVAMHAWPTLEPSDEPRWTGYWMDMSDADLREQAIALAHARASADAGERTRLASALGAGIGEPMHALLQRLVLLRGGPLDDHQRAALASLEDASTMLSRILADVVALSAGDEADMGLQATRVDLRGLLGSLETLLRPVALSKGLDLHQQVDAGVAAWLQADGTRLRQILFNLVGNAIKFTAQGGVSIIVQLLEEGELAQQLRIEVRDTGVGIPLDRQDAVFEAFTQAETSTTRDYGGTGLGLGICRQLVRRMGGTLVLRSAPGKGTVVVVELELLRGEAGFLQDGAGPSAEPPDLQPLAAPADGAAMPARRVLVAEDHPTQRLLMLWWLHGMGLEVDVAADGAQALALWRSGHPILLFTDARMPGLDGAGLVRRIREEEQLQGRPRMPIIGMSADIDGMRGVPLDYVLAKPISRGSLHEAVARVLPEVVAEARVAASAATAANAADTPSLASLAARFGTEQVAAELVHTLRVSLEEDLQGLLDDWTRVDTRAASQRLHRMAGGAGSLGLVALALHLGELSDAAVLLDEAQRMALQQRLQQCIGHLRGLEG